MEEELEPLFQVDDFSDETDMESEDESYNFLLHFNREKIYKRYLLNKLLFK